MSFWQTLLPSLIAGGVTGGLAGAIVRYLLDTHKQRYEYTMRLHENWWRPEFHQMRSQVYELVEDYKNPSGPGEKSKKFLASVAQGDVLAHPPVTPSLGFRFSLLT
jgi:hypothetical protein